MIKWAFSSISFCLLHPCTLFPPPQEIANRDPHLRRACTITNLNPSCWKCILKVRNERTQSTTSLCESSQLFKEKHQMQTIILHDYRHLPP